MKMLFPTARADVDPIAAYANDARPAPAGRPWLLVNMVSSTDGSATDAEGLSGGLSGTADKAVFAAIRGVADVIVAGAGTVTAEDYGPSRPSSTVRRQRLDRGQGVAPRIAVVSASLRLDPGRRLFAEAPAEARPLLVTVDEVDPARRQALEQVADVLTAGREQVSWPRALTALQQATGAGVVLCEGGPRTVAQLVADDLVDELCLTIAPTLVGGAGLRVAQGVPNAVDRALSLARVLSADGFLFLRYVRDRTNAA